MLLRNIQLSPSFDVMGDLEQSVDENPNIIFEQLLFRSDMDFDDCSRKICLELSIYYGQPVTANSIKQGEMSVSCYKFERSATELTVQVVREGLNSECNGFIHAMTRWMMHSG